jgi:hypothetical protein
MHVTFVKGVRGKKGFVEIEDARLIFKNFSGEASKYNKEGDRNFCISIPNRDIADSLKNDKNEFGVGWNVKIRPPRDADDDPLMFLKVKMSFNGSGPDVFLITNGKMNRLDEESIDCLDHVDISHVDLSIRPYDDEINGRPFRSAYLRSIYVTQNVDRLAARYAEEEYPEE